jgi:hypothetical protein
MEIEYAEKIIDIESIFAMREILIDDLGKAAARLDAAKEPIAILNHQECGPFDYYIVISGDKFYEVTRLNFFAQCTCKAFTENRICKHIPRHEIGVVLVQDLHNARRKTALRKFLGAFHKQHHGVLFHIGGYFGFHLFCCHMVPLWCLGF